MEKENAIVKNVALKVGAICIGNGGGQSGVELYNRGVEVMLINSSVRDLDDTVVPAGVRSYIIEDSNDLGRGAGRNREVAKKLFSEWNQNKKLMKSEYFDNFISSKDIIFIIASTAGGTGSGIAPTMAYQISAKYPSKVVIVCGILPRANESINSQQNTVQFFNEIEQLNQNINIPYMAFDLNKYAHMSIEDAYTKIAKDVASSIDVIRGEMAVLTKYGMIDERNMLTIVSCKGLISVYTADNIKMTDISEKGIQAIIKNKMKETSTVDVQKDKIAKYMGLFLEVDEGIEDPVKQADYSQLFETIGEPYEIFVNYGITDKPTAKFGLVLSGQSMPYDRLNICIDRIHEYENSVKEKSYSIAQQATEFSKYAKNESIDKILGSASATPIDDDAELPDFLKSSI